MDKPLTFLNLIIGSIHCIYCIKNFKVVILPWSCLHTIICSLCWIKRIVTDALSVDDRCFKGVISCLKCQGLLTRVTTSVKSQKEQRVIGILCLWDNVLIGTSTLFGAECVHRSFWGSQDWLRHRQVSIITLFYSAALPVRQHKRHIRAAHGDRTFERGRKRREESSLLWCVAHRQMCCQAVAHLQGEKLRRNCSELFSDCTR